MDSSKKGKPAQATTPDELHQGNEMQTPKQRQGDFPGNAASGKQENSVEAADWALLKKVPTLMAYIERVGARPKSFRRFVIEEHAGGEYHRDLATIRVDAEGKVAWSGNVAGPSEAEIKAIQKEVAAAGWPTPKKAAKGWLPDDLKTKPAEAIFQFLSPDGKHVLFIQHRFEPDGEPKVCIPWSYWSDDKWRQMEPDGLLPLFGLETLGDNTTVFIHEGPKAARHCSWMTGRMTQAARDAFDKHPWNKELSGAAHLGWAGGAPNPHRTDWSVLRRAGIRNIYVVADNDQLGQEAVGKISELTLLPMTAVLFDDCFKSGFDLADPWPGEKSDPPQPDWWRGKRYLGPMFHEMCIPATWATRKLETGKAGRPPIVLRDEFAAEWLMSSDPHLYTHRRYTDLMLRPEPFNKKIAPFAHPGTDVGELLARKLSTQADGITYRPYAPTAPGKEPRVITIDGRRLINAYRPPSVKAKSDYLLREEKPFLDYMEYLIPDKDDRFKVLRWCATLIARPQIRMEYGLLLISESQGIGKTTLADSILRPLIGPWNVSFPTEQQIADSTFNGWIGQKRLAVVSEIYSGEKRKCYNRTKAAITDKTIRMEKKFMEPFEIENHCHLFASSNSMLALQIDQTDRRYLIPTVNETVQNKSWWKAFYSWINGGGLPVIAAWAERFVQEYGPVEAGDRAPDTSRKQEVIDAVRSDGERLAYDLARQILAYREKEKPVTPLGMVVVKMDEVRSWVALMRKIAPADPRLEKVATLRKAMAAAGLMRPLNNGSEHRVRIGGVLTEVMANFPIGAGATWSEQDKETGVEKGLARFHQDPETFVKTAM